MRMRKKKWADPYLLAHPEYVIPTPSEFKGKWKELLNCSVLHVEIGMGKGDYLNAMAQMYPQDGFIGIEKDHSCGAVAARKALEGTEVVDLHNKRMIVSDAIHLNEWFEDGEIDVIHLNFSDPWPKKHYHKRRLSSDQFLDIYKRVLSEKGSIRMKTDNQGLFEDSVIYFVRNGFEFTEFSVDYRRNTHDEDAITEYESRFMSLGQPIYQLCAILPKDHSVIE